MAYASQAILGKEEQYDFTVNSRKSRRIRLVTATDFHFADDIALVFRQCQESTTAPPQCGTGMQEGGTETKCQDDRSGGFYHQ